jgi:hypothetical protein
VLCSFTMFEKPGLGGLIALYTSTAYCNLSLWGDVYCSGCGLCLCTELSVTDDIRRSHSSFSHCVCLTLLQGFCSAREELSQQNDCSQIVRKCNTRRTSEA